MFLFVNVVIKMKNRKRTSLRVYNDSLELGGEWRPSWRRSHISCGTNGIARGIVYSESPLHLTCKWLIICKLYDICKVSDMILCRGRDVCVFVCAWERERENTRYTENKKIVLTREKQPAYTKKRKRCLCSHLLSIFSYYNHLLGKRWRLNYLLNMCHRT